MKSTLPFVILALAFICTAFYVGKYAGTKDGQKIEREKVARELNIQDVK